MESSKKTEETKPVTAAGNEKKPEEKPKSVLELLEEDDEFEEFEGTTWDTMASHNEDGQLWQDDWEDDDVKDDFSQQLRAQIEAKTNEAAK